MKILITGNSGYIGSHLTKLLSKRTDFELYGLDRKAPQLPVIKIFMIVRELKSHSRRCRDILHATED